MTNAAGVNVVRRRPHHLKEIRMFVIGVVLTMLAGLIGAHVDGNAADTANLWLGILGNLFNIFGFALIFGALLVLDWKYMS
jgi:hypothetical protein